MLISLQGSGDQKFIPVISRDKLSRLAASVPSAATLWEQIQDPMFQTPPNVSDTTTRSGSSGPTDPERVLPRT